VTKRACGKIGQWIAVGFVALGLGAVGFGLTGFKKHQHEADEIDRLSMQAGRRASLLSAGTLHPAQQMARFNLLIWTGIQFSFFGVVVGVAAAAMDRSAARGAEAKPQAAAE
jgi:hypothetical protein